MRSTNFSRIPFFHIKHGHKSLKNAQNVTFQLSFHVKTSFSFVKLLTNLRWDNHAYWKKYVAVAENKEHVRKQQKAIAQRRQKDPVRQQFMKDFQKDHQKENQKYQKEWQKEHPKYQKQYQKEYEPKDLERRQEQKAKYEAKRKEEGLRSVPVPCPKGCGK